MDSSQNQDPKPVVDELEDTPVTMDKIKYFLHEQRVFDEREAGLTNEEKKELQDLWEYMTVAMTSRTRQPALIQNRFNTLKRVEKIVKEQLAGKHISESLASKFHWENLEQQGTINVEKREGQHTQDNLV